jgi:GntR family transcriptional repressor for pyruvate dehydrogenase complex
MLTRRAAAVASVDQVRRLRAIEEEMKAALQSGDKAVARRLSTGFHEYIGEIVGNFEAIRIRRTHSAIFRAMRSRYGYCPGRQAQIRIEHEAIIAAVERGDPDAADAASRLHARNSARDLLDRASDLP